MIMTTNIGNVVNAEDVTPFIVNISPAQAVLYKMLPETTVHNVLHTWLTDTYATPDATPIPEGADFTEDTPTTPVELSNYTQIFRKAYKVSMSQQVSKPKVNIKNMLAYQMAKAMKEIAMNVNKAIIENASAQGGTNRKMGGVPAFVPTDHQISSTGGSLQEEKFLDACQKIYDAGGLPRVAVMNSSVKRQTHNFYGQATEKFASADDDTIYNVVSVYESDFGNVVLKIDPQMPSDKVYVLDTEYWRVGYLRRFKKQRLAEGIGDYVGAVIIGELTLEALEPKTSAIITITA